MSAQTNSQSVEPKSSPAEPKTGEVGPPTASPVVTNHEALAVFLKARSEAA